ncbi:hypothetical protein [Rhodococcus sp. NPDC056516]|uniref:hypothetical protein n=1 Tax=Rhodococcus sp. NPDC056516 TaxID=3345847 RepID=UPI003670F856
MADNVNQEKVQELVSLHLVGERFHGTGTPAAALAEVVALDDLIRRIARLIWKNENPNRTRALRNFDSNADLRLTDIAPGSKTPTLSRITQESDLALFDADPLGPAIEKAVDALIEYVKAAATGGEIPEVIRQVGGAKMKGLGRSLTSEQYLQIDRPQSQNWTKAPRFTADSRNKALSRLNANFKKTVELDGQLKALDLLQKKATLQTFDKGLVQISWQNTGLNFNVDERADQGIFCTVSGRGEFNSSGKLIKIEDEVDISNLVTAETRDRKPILAYFLGKRKLHELTRLDDGWIDGKSGAPIEHAVIKFAELLHTNLLGRELNTQFIFPTENGGLQFEWPQSNGKASVEIEIDQTIISAYAHRIIAPPPGYAEFDIEIDIENSSESEWQRAIIGTAGWIERNQ